MVSTAKQIFRNNTVDGVPASGPHTPQKAEIRDWGTWLESFVTASGSNAGTIFETRTQLYANLNYAPNTMAWVINDPVTAYNGIYGKAGASGAGTWARLGDLPYSFVRMIDTGAGTANAIHLASDLPTSMSILRVANIFEANSGDVTISENESVSKPLLTNTGNEISPGGLIAGMLVLYIDFGSSYRLITDQVSASIVAAAEEAAATAEAAKTAAEAARDTALAAVPTVFSTTRTALKALPITTTAAYLKEIGREGQFVLRTGGVPISDPNEGIFVVSDTSGYYWERLAHGMKFDVRWFGAKLDNSTDDTAAFQATITFASLWANTPYSPLAEVYCPPGYIYKTTGTINLTKPLRLRIMSINFYYNTAGAAYRIHETVPVGYPSQWDIYFEGVLATPGAGGFPASPNPAGTIGFSIRAMTFSRFECRQLNGFSYAAIELDGRGLTYSTQIIQHNHFILGQVVNSGYGIWAQSLDAATSSVQANRFDIQNIYQNCVNISLDQAATYHATTSNTFWINAMDNETAVGIDIHGSYNRFYVGFAGAPGMTVRMNGDAKYNHFEFNNNYSTDIVVTFGGVNNTLNCKAPNNLPATGVGVANNTVYTNNYGCPVDIYFVANGGGTYLLSVGTHAGAIDMPANATANGGLVHIRVPNGGKWRVFTVSGTVSFTAATVLPSL